MQFIIARSLPMNFLLNCNSFFFNKRANVARDIFLISYSSTHSHLTPFQFTPMARVPSLFFSQSHFRECQFLDLDRFAPQRARFTRHYYSQLSTLQTCHCSPVAIELRYPTRSAEIGIDGQEPGVVPPAFRIIPTETFLLSSEQRGHDEPSRSERQPSAVIFINRSRGMPAVNRTSRVLHEPLRSNGDRPLGEPFPRKIRASRRAGKKA
jgi:hypothetical protein